MSIRQLLKARSVLGAFLGDKALTVGKGGRFPDLKTALTVAGDKITLLRTRSLTMSAVNGDVNVAGVGTNWRSVVGPKGASVRVGDLVQIGDDPRYYKVRRVPSNTQIILWEPYQGPTFFNQSGTEFSEYYLDWTPILLLPGLHMNGDPLTENTAAAWSPGLILAGLDRDSTILGDAAVSTTHPLQGWGENKAFNIKFGDSRTIGGMDGLTNDTPPTITLWGGAESVFSNLLIDHRGLNGDHPYAGLRLPVPPGGRLLCSNVDILSDGGFPDFTTVKGGDITESTTNTFVDFRNVNIRTGQDFNSGQSPALFGGVQLDVAANYRFRRVSVEIPDESRDSGFGQMAGVQVLASVVADFSGLEVKGENSSDTDDLAAVSVTGAATVNITHGDLEVSNAGTANSIGLFVSNASATINVRGSRIKGDTTIQNDAGTVNVDTVSTLIGGVPTGAGTTNTATDT